MVKKQLSKESSSELKAFLRIKHPSINPDDITRVLALQPEHTVQAGTDVSGAGVRRLHSESYWLASLKMESREDMMRSIQQRAQQEALPSPIMTLEALKDFRGATSIFEVRLIRVLNQLNEKREFLARIVSDGGSITLLIQNSTTQESITLSPVLMRLLSDLFVTVEID